MQSTRPYAYHYRLTPAQEDQLLTQIELRKMLTDKALCAVHNISRSTLRLVLKRARARRGNQTPEQKD